MQIKNNIGAFIRIIISFGLLGGLFWIMRDDIKGIWNILSSSNLWILAVALLLLLLNVCTLAYRLKVIFLGENLEMTIKEALQLTFVGYFFNNFMPTAVGGDIVKAHYAAHANKQKLKSYASVLMDRFIGLYTFLIVAGVALIVDQGRFKMAAVRSLVMILLVLGIVGFIVATNRAVARFLGKFFMRIKMFRLGERLDAVYNIVHDYRNRKDVVFKSFAISVLAQCVYFTVVYLFFYSLGVRISPGNIFIIMPVVTFISMIPSIGGLGVREGAFVALFTSLAGKEISFAVSLLLLFSLLFLSFIGGFIYLKWSISGVRKEVKIEEESGIV